MRWEVLFEACGKERLSPSTRMGALRQAHFSRRLGGLRVPGVQDSSEMLKDQ